jgi:hypothetical protein
MGENKVSASTKLRASHRETSFSMGEKVRFSKIEKASLTDIIL